MAVDLPLSMPGDQYLHGGDSWFILCTQITQCATGAQPPAAPDSNQTLGGEAA